MIKIEEVLKEKGNDIWSIASKETAYKALGMMADKDIGALLVIDNGELVGIFSERDYARKVILKGRSSKETTVGELMIKIVYTITPDKSVEECMALMKAVKCRHMPVLDKNRLIGIVTMGDIVTAVIREKNIMIHDLKQYIYSTEYTDVSNNP